MNRRILLIDTDPTFRTTLTITVQKYRIDVLHEPDADDAVAVGTADPPDLLIVGVEEPEKAGFKIFQRLKKGPLSKTPIMLVTGSVPRDSFAKHKNLKTHADSYVDKRGLTRDALAEAIDGLIGLGEPGHADDDLDIPVEVDDIHVGDGAVIDEEAPDDDVAGEYVGDQKTVMGGPDRRIDASVADDIDDAFAGLMGDDVPMDVPAASPAPAPAPARSEPAILRREPAEDEFDDLPQTRTDHAATMHALRSEKKTAPPPIAGAAGSEATQLAAAAYAEDPVPAPIHDGGRSDDLDDRFDSFSQESPRPGYQVEEVLMSKDMIPVEDLAAEAEAEAPVAQAAADHTERPLAVFESSPAIQLADDDVELLSDGDLVDEDVAEAPQAAAADDDADDAGGIPEPVPHPRSAEDAAEAAAARDSKPVKKFIESSTQTGVPPGASSPSIDLGLEKIAEDAHQEQQSGGYPRADSEPDQSGVHDRRALRKIGELERQITQLKTELDRARQVADAAAKGGGREQTFLNLREKMVAAESELKRVRADLVARDAALAELTDKLRAAHEQGQSLEGKSRELEQRLAAETARAGSLDGQQQELAGTLRSLQGELGEKSEALAATEKARAQLESELASERALRAASSSDAERQLRSEREQLVAQHQGELAQLRQELAAKHETEVDAVRAELAQQQQAAVAAAIEATRQTVAGEAEDAVAQLEQQREQDIAALRAEHQAALDKLKAELDVQLAEARAALDTAAAAHERALAEQADHHAAALAARERELATARQDDAIAHTAAIAELRAELDRTIAEHGSKLDGARRELDELVALQEKTKSEAAAEAAAAQARLAAEHAAELARVEADKQRAIDDIQRAAAEHKAAIERAAEQHRAELATQREAADREVAELRQMLVGAKRQMDDVAAKHQGEREQLEKQHAQALAEQVAQHERAIALANGEIVKVKAVADSEHTRAMTAAKAEWERAKQEIETTYRRQLEEVTTERDELQRGLSAARDTIKRSEGELATAVQTIADRNAELRSAAAAIAERDQRIGDLRKELEALEQENANYQEQVLRAYQKIKSDEAMVARAKKAMAIALTVLDDPGSPKTDPT